MLIQKSGSDPMLCVVAQMDDDWVVKRMHGSMAPIPNIGLNIFLFPSFFVQATNLALSSKKCTLKELQDPNDTYGVELIDFAFPAPKIKRLAPLLDESMSCVVV